MKYKSQQVAYWFFALSMVLLILQITYGFVMAFAHLGYDGLHDIIPFNAATATHKNLLVVKLPSWMRYVLHAKQIGARLFVIVSSWGSADCVVR